MLKDKKSEFIKESTLAILGDSMTGRIIAIS